MSALCQKRTSRVFDDVIGLGKQGQRDSKAERLGRFEIDCQLVLGRHLDRKISRVFALEDTIDVTGRAAELVQEVRPIGDQSAIGDEEACVIDRRQFVPSQA